MQRVDTVDELYHDGDPEIPTEGTDVVAEPLNSIQEELANVIEDDGIALDPENDHQVSQRISARIAAHSGLVCVTNDPHGYVMPYSEVFGCALSNNATDAAHDINISVGRRCNGDGSANMVLASAMTKRIDAAWTAGTNQGGLDTGTVAAGTWYHVFLIKNTTSGAVDVLMSASLSPTMPTGYTKKRRLGSILTDGSADILAFTQFNDTFLLSVPVVGSDFAVSGTAESRIVATPLGVRCSPILNASVNSTASTGVIHVYSPAQGEPSGDSGAIISYDATHPGPLNIQITGLYTNLSSQIMVKANPDLVFFFTLTTVGWVDDRGKNII